MQEAAFHRALDQILGDGGDPVPVEDLFAWIEHPRMDNFRTHVLRPLHSERLIEYDRDTATAVLSQTPHPSLEQVKQGLAGNLCRCGTHTRILNAVMRVAKS